MTRDRLGRSVKSGPKKKASECWPFGEERNRGKTRGQARGKNARASARSHIDDDDPDVLFVVVQILLFRLRFYRGAVLKRRRSFEPRPLEGNLSLWLFWKPSCATHVPPPVRDFDAVRTSKPSPFSRRPNQVSPVAMFAIYQRTRTVATVLYAVATPGFTCIGANRFNRFQSRNPVHSSGAPQSPSGEGFIAGLDGVRSGRRGPCAGVSGRLEDRFGRSCVCNRSRGPKGPTRSI